MAFRGDITVDWSVSPRIITVASPSTEIVIQDLHDTLRTLEAQSSGMDEAPIISSAGKESLGGGVAVGLTSTLLNAQLAFEARPGPTWVLCKITGGNLVAKDSGGSDIDPRYPTAFVTVDRASSSSATTQGVAAISYMSFDNVVSIDAINGFSIAGFTGDPALLGNREFPVNNIVDAVIIANNYNITTLIVKGNLTLDVGEDVSGFFMIGQGASINSSRTNLTMVNGCITVNTKMKDMRVDGYQGGEIVYDNCVIGAIDNMHCQFENCTLVGPISRAIGGWTSNHISFFVGCQTSKTQFIDDMDGTGLHIEHDNASGGFKIMNMNTVDAHYIIRLDAGHVEIDSSCVNGNVIVSGVGTVLDNSGAGCTVDKTGFIDTVDLALMLDMAENKADIDSDTGIAKHYAKDGLSIVKQFTITEVGTLKTRTPV